MKGYSKFGIIASSYSVSTPFSPIDLSPSLWLDAEDTGGRHAITANGNAKITTGKHTLTNVGSATFTSGKNNNAFTLNGSNQYFTSPDSDDFNMTSSDCTFSIWFYLDSFSTNVPLMNQINNSNDWSFYCTTSNGGRLAIGKIGIGGTETYSADSTITTGQWYHGVMTRISGTTQLYINGVASGSSTTNNWTTNSSNELRIARDYYTSANRYVNGQISNLSILKGKGLSAEEVLALYNNNGVHASADEEYIVFDVKMDGSNNSTVFVDSATPADTGAMGSWNDKSGNYNHFTQSTASYMPTFQENVLNGLPVVRYDGSNDRLEDSQNVMTTGTNPFEIFIVAKCDQNTTNQRLLASTNDYVTGSSTIRFKNTGTGQWAYGVGSSTITAGAWGTNWNIIGAVNTASNLYFRLNGSQVGTASGTPNITATNYHLGSYRSADGLEWWDGDIAEIIIYNTALSDEDRQAVETYLSNKYGISI